MQRGGRTFNHIAHYRELVVGTAPRAGFAAAPSGWGLRGLEVRTNYNMPEFAREALTDMFAQGKATGRSFTAEEAHAAVLKADECKNCWLFKVDFTLARVKSFFSSSANKAKKSA